MILMKNKILITLCLLSTFSFGQNFVVVVDDENIKTREYFEVIEEAGEWQNNGAKYNCSYSPLNNDYYKDVSFSQDSNCQQNQKREVNVYHKSLGSEHKIFIETKIENQTISINETNSALGTYLASSCKDVVDHYGKDGNGVYEITEGNVYCDMDYKDGSGYKRTHLYNPDRTLLGSCTYWKDTRAEWCSNYTDTVYFNLNKENYAYMEYVTYNYAGTPHNGNSSIITVDGIDKSYNLLSPVLHSIDLSNNHNGNNKKMIIRFTHDANIPGDNNMGVKEIYLYEQ
tara:strand:- start:12328 stop:13182 length:855 start_codon:yes stop_codon:yes gene_type:complete